MRKLERGKQKDAADRDILCPTPASATSTLRAASCKSRATLSLPQQKRSGRIDFRVNWGFPCPRSSFGFGRDDASFVFTRSACRMLYCTAAVLYRKKRLMLVRFSDRAVPRIEVFFTRWCSPGLEARPDARKLPAIPLVRVQRRRGLPYRRKIKKIKDNLSIERVQYLDPPLMFWTGPWYRDGQGSSVALGAVWGSRFRLGGRPSRRPSAPTSRHCTLQVASATIGARTYFVRTLYEPPFLSGPCLGRHENQPHTHVQIRQRHQSEKKWWFFFVQPRPDSPKRKYVAPAGHIPEAAGIGRLAL